MEELEQGWALNMNQKLRGENPTLYQEAFETVKNLKPFLNK